MPTTCCLVGCRSRFAKANNIQFFSFPFKDEERVAAWIATISRPNWTPTKSSKVCSKHFVPSDYLDRPGGYVKHLKNNAVPSMNLSNTVYMQKSQIKEKIENDCKDNVGNQIVDNVRRKATIVKGEGNPRTTELKGTLCSEQSSDKMWMEVFFDQNENENVYSDSLEDNDTKPSYEELHQMVRMLQQQIRRKNKVINSLKQILEELTK